jgi:thiol-disulfide isomerase/thioredoxin
MRNLLFATLLVFAASSSGSGAYRPYVVVHLAKAIMTTGDAPDDPVADLCDGTGWITHGDGHKTECPGCAACKKNDPEPISKKCQCGCKKSNCNCTKGQRAAKCIKRNEPSGQFADLLAQEIAQLEGADQNNIMVYHMGATWCGPCRDMKEKTWANSELKKFMLDNRIKLHIMDEDDKDNDYSKFFKYYKIGAYPTMLVVERDNLNNPVKRVKGFVGHQTVLSILKAVIDE